MIGFFRGFRQQSLRRCFSSNNFKDYYAVLGISANANEEEIAAAYKKLARQYHPGITKGYSGKETKKANELFKEITEAYTILSNENQRLQYDRTNQKNPSFLAEKIKNERALRGADGNPLGSGETNNSYAGEFQDFLKKERKRFNVHKNNTYQGGVPSKGEGRKRANAFREPGRFHSVQEHRDHQHHMDSELHVDMKRAFEYENIKESEKGLQSLRTHWYRATVEKQFVGMKNHATFLNSLRWFLIILFGVQVLNQNFKSSILREVEEIKEAAQDGIEVDGKGHVNVGSNSYKIYENGVIKKMNQSS